jgi:hypothetical protein
LRRVSKDEAVDTRQCQALHGAEAPNGCFQLKRNEQLSAAPLTYSAASLAPLFLALRTFASTGAKNFPV